MNIADKTLKQNLEWSEEYTKDLTIPGEWENVSYKDDLAPSWHCNGWQIYIHHYNKEIRSQVDAEFRFCVMLSDGDNCDHNYNEGYFCTDDFNLVKKIVHNKHERI
tara:strand:+ start:29 stop:346 length:318 start_codon:yes stop_codon:yes gene_type:complete